MENKNFRRAVFCLALTAFLSACSVSDWLPHMMDITKDIMTTFIEAKANRSDETAELVKVETPSFVTGRSEASAAQQSFFEKIKRVEYITPAMTGEPLRSEIKSRVNAHTGAKNIIKLYASVNNYVIGRVEGANVHDVMVIKDDGVQVSVFGMQGIFPKKDVEALSHSGDIFATMDYLKR